METSTLKNKIHSLVEGSDEETLQSIYQLFNEAEYTDEFKNILNEERANYEKSKQVISKAEMNKLIQEMMNKPK